VWLADVGAVGLRISNGLWARDTTDVIGE